MRWIPLLLLCVVLAGCSNPWASGYERNPLLGKTKFKPTAAVDVKSFQFEKLQQFGRIELALAQATTRAATQPATEPAPFSHQTAQVRLLNTMSLTSDKVTLLGWSEFENWELLNDDEPRLLRLAKHLGADYVLVASAYTNKPLHDVVSPRTIWQSAMTTTPGKPNGMFGPKPPRVVWYTIGSEPDKYLYDVLFFKRK